VWIGIRNTIRAQCPEGEGEKEELAVHLRPQEWQPFRRSTIGLGLSGESHLMQD